MHGWEIIKITSRNIYLSDKDTVNNAMPKGPSMIFFSRENQGQFLISWICTKCLLLCICFSSFFIGTFFIIVQNSRSNLDDGNVLVHIDYSVSSIED